MRGNAGSGCGPGGAPSVVGAGSAVVGLSAARPKGWKVAQPLTSPLMTANGGGGGLAWPWGLRTGLGGALRLLQLPLSSATRIRTFRSMLDSATLLSALANPISSSMSSAVREEVYESRSSSSSSARHWRQQQKQQTTSQSTITPPPMLVSKMTSSGAPSTSSRGGATGAAGAGAAAIERRCCRLDGRGAGGGGARVPQAGRGARHRRRAAAACGMSFSSRSGVGVFQAITRAADSPFDAWRL